MRSYAQKCQEIYIKFDLRCRLFEASWKPQVLEFNSLTPYQKVLQIWRKLDHWFGSYVMMLKWCAISANFHFLACVYYVQSVPIKRNVAYFLHHNFQTNNPIYVKFAGPFDSHNWLIDSYNFNANWYVNPENYYVFLFFWVFKLKIIKFIWIKNTILIFQNVTAYFDILLP